MPKERRIDKNAASISERRGGLGVPNLVLREEGTGKVVFDNRDVTAMAKWNIARGGSQMDALAPNAKKLFAEKYWELIFCEPVTCPKCKSTVAVYPIGHQQNGQLFTGGEVRGNRCQFCWTDYELYPFRDDAHKADYELKKPWIDKYYSIHINRWEEKFDLIIQFIKETGYKIEDQIPGTEETP